MGDGWVSLEAFSVPVLMQPKTSSDAHLTPCACYRAGQGQALLGIAPFAWRESTSPSHFLHLQLPVQKVSIKAAVKQHGPNEEQPANHSLYSSAL